MLRILCTTTPRCLIPDFLVHIPGILREREGTLARLPLGVEQWLSFRSSLVVDDISLTFDRCKLRRRELLLEGGCSTTGEGGRSRVVLLMRGRRNVPVLSSYQVESVGAGDRIEGGADSDA